MIIGILELPNKWAITAQITNAPFIYSNGLPFWDNASDSWGGTLAVHPYMKNYKVVAQDGFRITEYWCIGMQIPNNGNILYPVAMKRFGYDNLNTKCFAFRNPIYALQIEVNRCVPNFNMAGASERKSVGEFFIGMFEDGAAANEPWNSLYWRMYNDGKLNIAYPSGKITTLPEVIRNTATVDMYSKGFFNQLNGMGDLHEVGISNGYDILNQLYDFCPVNARCEFLDLEWIGECILDKNLINCTYEDILSSCSHTGFGNNLMRILFERVKMEELINVENLVTRPLADVRPAYEGRNYTAEQASVQNCVDNLANCFYSDDATTVAFEYDLVTGKTNSIERVYAYGECTPDRFRINKVQEASDNDFLLRDMCEALNAWKIRAIKTYNEELFLTVWYNNGQVESYYVNLIVHLCVSGCLFGG